MKMKNKLTKKEKRENSRLLRELSLSLEETQRLLEYLDDTVELELRNRGVSPQNLENLRMAVDKLEREVKP